MSRVTHILASAGVCAAAITAVGGAAAAGAASCSTIACVEHQVTALTKEVKKQGSELKTDSKTLTTDSKELKTDDETVSALNTCLTEAPLTRYGDTGGTFGYAFTPTAGAAAQDTTGLDVTRTGTSVQAWFLFDACNTATTLPTGAAADRARVADRALVGASVFGPIAPRASLAIFSSDRP